jgi:hypothetical protein
MYQLKNWLIVASLFAVTAVSAQFPPQVGNPGTTAIHKDSILIKAWATSCTLNKGWQNISDTSLGRAQVGDETYVPGPAANGVVSLGDGGEAIVTFQHPIINGAGYDFAVFENGFTDQSLDSGTAFLELAYVEVSSDGVNFIRFEATSNNDTATQLPGFQGMDASKINNLAGKYTTNYGTPFDLEELKDTPGLDVNNITHIKIIDVVGSINNKYATRDAGGRKVNDPWPTPFASSGFDLDAVAVINHNTAVAVHEVLSEKTVGVYPNPALAHAPIVISFPVSSFGSVQDDTFVSLYDMMGKEIRNFELVKSENQLNITIAQRGVYQLVINDGTSSVAKRIIIQ